MSGQALPRTRWEVYSIPPDSLAGLKEREGKDGRRGKGEERKGKDPQCLKCADAPA